MISQRPPTGRFWRSRGALGNGLDHASDAAGTRVDAGGAARPTFVCITRPCAFLRARTINSTAPCSPKHKQSCIPGVARAEWAAPTITGGRGARSVHRRRPFDSRHEQPGRVQQPGTPASAGDRGDPRPGRAKLCFVTNAWGAEPRARAGRTAAGEVGLRGRAGVLHPRRCRRQRARGEVRAPGMRARPAAGSSRAIAPITARATLAMALSGDARTAPHVDADALSA